MPVLTGKDMTEKELKIYRLKIRNISVIVCHYFLHKVCQPIHEKAIAHKNKSTITQDIRTAEKNLIIF